MKRLLWVMIILFVAAGLASCTFAPDAAPTPSRPAVVSPTVIPSPTTEKTGSMIIHREA